MTEMALQHVASLAASYQRHDAWHQYGGVNIHGVSAQYGGWHQPAGQLWRESHVWPWLFSVSNQSESSN